MNAAKIYSPGGYRYLPGVSQYSAGVAAEPGFAMERVRWRRPLPLEQAFKAAEAQLAAAGRPLHAFCACELRIAAPFSEDEFASFNQLYVGMLQRWGIAADGINPVARTNVCPATFPPSVPSMFAFSYTIPAPQDAGPSFVVAGSGEVPEGKATYRDHIVARGDVSSAGLRRKARFVLDEMERRLGMLGFAWGDATAVQLYTVHDPHPLMEHELAPRHALLQGLNWHFARPPVAEIEFEMDVRGVDRERLV